MKNKMRSFELDLHSRTKLLHFQTVLTAVNPDVCEHFFCLKENPTMHLDMDKLSQITKYYASK